MRRAGSCEDLCDANGWRNTTLGALVSEADCFIQTGPFGSQLHKHDYQEDGIGVVNPTHLIGNKIMHDDVPLISSETASRLAKHRLSTGDILFARRGEIGRHGLVTEAEDGWLCGTGCFLVRIRRKDVDNQFLCYLFSTRDTVEWLNRHAAGVVMPNLSNTVLQSLPIRIPSLPEQRKIAAVLGLVRRAIEQQERLVALTTELKKALLHKLFTQGLRGEPQKQTEIGPVPKSWEIVRLGDAFDTQLGKMLSQKAHVGNDPKPYLRNKNVQWGRIDLSDMLQMDFNEREKEKFLLVRGDLLVCEGGEPGRAAIWNGDMQECYYQKALHRLRPKDERITNEFLAYWMAFSFQLQNLYGVAGASSTISHLPEVQLKALPMPRPERFEQDEMCDALRQLDGKISMLDRKRVILTDLFRSLLHQLMTAQIRFHELDTSALPELCEDPA
jgi:type I restriction enzyme S subunit